MKYLIPRKLYPMPAQAVVENKAIAREDIPLLRKSATGKGYTGSMSKKKRIAKKRTENKSRQRKIGKADVPQEAFHAIKYPDFVFLQPETGVSYLPLK